MAKATERVKNALVTYEIGAVPSGGSEEVEYMRLARYIRGATDATDETVEDEAYMDGDGTPESDVVTVKMAYEFEGMYLDTDPAMNYIRSIELETGASRKVMFRITRLDGRVYEGLATVTGISTSGGTASEFEEFKCTIGYDRKPTITEGGSP